MLGSSLLAAVLCALPACAGPGAPSRTVPDGGRLAEDLRGDYLRALEEAAAGDGRAADRALEPLLPLRPVHVPSHLLHQDLARAAGEGGTLREGYAALAAEPGSGANAEVLRVRAAGGSAEERIAGYQAAAAQEPAAPWPHIALAAARAELARELVRRAEVRARDGFAAEAEQLRADARASAERACTEGERAAAVAPDLAPAHAALGHARAVAATVAAGSQGERKDLRAKALDSLGRALALDPGDARVLLDRAAVHRDTERWEEAQADLDAAARYAPRDPGILSARARNLESRGGKAEAADAWRAAAAAAPRDPDILLDCGSALARAGRWDEALAVYRRADAAYAAAAGPRWRARRGLVTALTQRGLDEGDRALLDEALAQLGSYRAEGGLDEAWAAMMEELLAGDKEAKGAKEAAPTDPPPPPSPPNPPSR